MGSAVREHYTGDKMMNEQYSPYFKNGMRERIQQKVTKRTQEDVITATDTADF